MNKAAYLAYIQQAYAAEKDKVDESVEQWRSQFRHSTLFGYYPPRAPLHVGAVAAFLYEQTGKTEYARQAADLFLRYREYTHVYPQAARDARPEYANLPLPPLDCAFDPILFGPAVERIQPVLTPAETTILADIAADSLAMVWRFPEWGGHNRAMLRAASLAVCAHAFPQHPAAAEWGAMADELSEESWGRWSIEDTMMYQSHWLRALIQYAEARGKTEFSDFLQPRMHIKSMVQMLTPRGNLPSYGDSHNFVQWEWLAVMEWAAGAYQDAAMKWAAGRIWAERSQAEPCSMYGALVLISAYRWCDDALEPAQPHSVPDALDDLVLKKIVYRTGWDAQAAYACLNYRDEGDYGWVAREYLRTNLAASAEKMHHGHSDEGSFVALVCNDTLLLHDGGYRENPPDGLYRGDRFHNRLVWRPTLGLPGDDIWNHLADNGFYHAVRTERLYQTRLLDAQFTRVRTQDETQKLIWDRSVVFFPDLPAWLVIDSALALAPAQRTLSQLWWTRQILDQGPDWLETWIDQAQNWKNTPGTRLRILQPAIPGQPTPLSTHSTRRNFQEEKVIISAWRGHHLPGRMVNFVSLLWPHRDDAGEFPALNVLASQPEGRGIAICLAWQGSERQISVLNDLTSGYIQEDIRPRYTFAQGRCEYGPVTSDAAFTYVLREGGKNHIGFINGTRLEYEGAVLHQAPLSGMFQEDRSDLPGVPARFRWEGEFA